MQVVLGNSEAEYIRKPGLLQKKGENRGLRSFLLKMLVFLTTAARFLANYRGTETRNPCFRNRKSPVLLYRRKWMTSIRPLSLRNIVVRKLRTLYTIEAKSAVKKPSTVKPDSIFEVISKRSALITKMKSPSVRMVSGSVNRIRSGLRNVLSRPRMMPAKMRERGFV